jgi:hypothetical protein
MGTKAWKNPALPNGINLGAQGAAVLRPYKGDSAFSMAFP